MADAGVPLSAADALRAWAVGRRAAAGGGEPLPRVPKQRRRQTPLEVMLDYARRVAGDATARGAAASGGSAPLPARPKSDRHTETLSSRLCLGEEIWAWKREHAGERAWLCSFTEQRYAVKKATDPLRLRRLISFCSRCKHTYDKSLTEVGVESGRTGQGKRVEGCRCQRAPMRREDEASVLDGRQSFPRSVTSFPSAGSTGPRTSRHACLRKT